MMRLCSLCLGWCDWNGVLWTCSDCGEVWYTPDMTTRYPSVTPYEATIKRSKTNKPLKVED
jgi:hypothetical protein